LKVEFGKAIEIYGLSIIHLNCTSLVKHFDELKDFLINNNSNNKVDVIALSETWLMPSKHELSDFVLDKYSLNTSSRNSQTGGGFAIYVNNGFNQKVMCNISKVIEYFMQFILIGIAVKIDRFELVVCLNSSVKQ